MIKIKVVENIGLKLMEIICWLYVYGLIIYIVSYINYTCVRIFNVLVCVTYASHCVYGMSLCICEYVIVILIRGKCYLNQG